MLWMNGLTTRGRNGLLETMKLTNIQILSVKSLNELVQSKYLRFENETCYFGEVYTPFIGKKGWQEILKFLLTKE
jgi:hypothetical protein